MRQCAGRWHRQSPHMDQFYGPVSCAPPGEFCKKCEEFSTVAAQFVHNLDQKEWIRAVDDCGRSPADGKLIVISGACRAYQRKF